MSMELIQIIILNALLLVAYLWDIHKGEIPPVLCLGGGVLGVVCSLTANAVCTWQEALIAIVVTYVLILIFYIITPNVVGGGVLKSIVMSSAYLGRYTVILIVLFAVALGAVMFFYKRRVRKKGYMPPYNVLEKLLFFYRDKNKEHQFCAVPFLLAASLITSALVYFMI